MFGDGESFARNNIGAVTRVFSAVLRVGRMPGIVRRFRRDAHVLNRAAPIETLALGEANRPSHT